MADEADMSPGEVPPADEVQEALVRRGPRLWGILAGLLALIVLAAGGGLLWLDSAGGHRFIVRQINALEFQNG
ncbi:MAG: hypothetical protein B7Y87_03055, partial [Sphingomonadales bacterium 32-64-22]